MLFLRMDSSDALKVHLAPRIKVNSIYVEPELRGWGSKSLKFMERHQTILCFVELYSTYRSVKDGLEAGRVQFGGPHSSSKFLGHGKSSSNFSR